MKKNKLNDFLNFKKYPKLDLEFRKVFSMFLIIFF